MRSKKIELRIVWRLLEAAEARCKEENYRTLPRYLIGLILRDVMTPQRHLVVQAIANSEPDVQDELLDLFLAVDRDRLRRVILRVARELRGNNDHIYTEP